MSIILLPKTNIQSAAKKHIKYSITDGEGGWRWRLFSQTGDLIDYSFTGFATEKECTENLRNHEIEVIPFVDLVPNLPQ